MLQHQLQEALDAVELGLAHVLDLLRDVREIEFVREVAPRPRETTQDGSLFLRPGVDVVVVGRGAFHRPLYLGDAFAGTALNRHTLVSLISAASSDRVTGTR